MEIAPGSWSTSGTGASGSPWRVIRVRAAWAMRTRDWLVSTSQAHGVLHRVRRRHRRQVLVRQRVVPGDAGVADGAVQAGHHTERAGEVLRHQGGLQCRDVGVRHGHQPALGQPDPPRGGVLEQGVAGQDAAVQVQFHAVLQHRGGGLVDPGAVVDAEPQGEPVGDVDQALVLHRAAADLGLQSVEHAADVGPGVVHAVRAGLRPGPPGGEVAVPQGAQGLPESLLLGVHALVDQQPTVHVRSGSSTPPLPTKLVEFTTKCRSSSMNS